VLSAPSAMTPLFQFVALAQLPEASPLTKLVPPDPSKLVQVPFAAWMLGAVAKTVIRQTSKPKARPVE
jgi:hypothetical protein